jgi:hypothetical protein
MIQGWMLKPIVKALFALFDAVKDLDARLKWLERADAIAMSPMRQTARHDAVWESIDIGAKQLKLLKELEEAKPSHGEHCIDIGAKQLKLLKELEEAGAKQLKLLKELEEAKPSHGEHCNCLDCRTARGGEPI